MSDIRADIAALEASIGDLHAAVARTGLAAYGSPDDTDLRREADQALASLRDASDRLQQLTAALSLAEQQEAAAVANKAGAKRQEARDKLIRQRDLLQLRADKASEKLFNEKEKLPAASSALENLRQQWTKQQLVVEVIQERIGDFEHQAADAWSAVELADKAILDFDTPPPTAAEVLTAGADEQAARIAELEAETDAQLRKLADAAMVEVEPVRVLSSHPGWRFAEGLVVAVPASDLGLFAAEKSRAEEEAAERGAAVSSFDTRPWRKFQGPQYGLGLEPAIRLWAKTAAPKDIKSCVAAARARDDQHVVDVLSTLGAI